MLSKEIIWLGGLTAAAATGLYILFGPTDKKKAKNKDLCPGLYNFGNTCFLNSILQSMASCPRVSKWLKDSVTEQTNSPAETLTGTISGTLDVLNNEGEVVVDSHCPSDVFTALRIKGWVISGYDEQDAHELFHVLTQSFDEETAKYPRIVSLFDADSIENKSLKYQTEKEAICRSRNLLPVLPHRDQEHPLRGLLASQLHCNECGYRNPVRYDIFDSLSLSIPASVWGSKRLDSLLQHYVSVETVHNVECPGCAKFKYPNVNLNASKIPLPRATFCKKLTIGKLPHCLCFHIQRTQWLDNGSAIKRSEHISYPEILHMDDFVYSKVNQKNIGSQLGLVGGKDHLMFRNSSTKTSGHVNLLRALNYDSNITRNGIFLQTPNTTPSHMATDIHSDVNHNAPNVSKHSQSECTYKLSAVVVHLGDVMSGHFVTYRRSPGTVRGGRKLDRWLYCSDTTVRRVDIEDVLNQEAYMLFYERI